MARNDGIDRTSARNVNLTAAKIGNAQRHNERNAGARHIDLHFAAQILLDLLPAFCRYHGQQHRLQRLQKLFPQLGE